MSNLRLTAMAIALSTGLFAEDSLIGKWSCSMSDGDTYGILNFRPDHKFEFRDVGVAGSWSGDSDNFNAEFDDSFKGERFTGGVVKGMLYIRHNRFGAMSCAPLKSKPVEDR